MQWSLTLNLSVPCPVTVRLLNSNQDLALALEDVLYLSVVFHTYDMKL